jgi:hypothetical protein
MRAQLCSCMPGTSSHLSSAARSNRCPGFSVSLCTTMEPAALLHPEAAPSSSDAPHSGGWGGDQAAPPRVWPRSSPVALPTQRKMDARQPRRDADPYRGLAYGRQALAATQPVRYSVHCADLLFRRCHTTTTASLTLECSEWPIAEGWQLPEVQPACRRSRRAQGSHPSMRST